VWLDSHNTVAVYFLALKERRIYFRTRRGQQVVRMTSTLVETVSINYEDFNESFLTCGTCLCTYDGAEHTPKLLPCSHTGLFNYSFIIVSHNNKSNVFLVCLHCLGRIAASTVPTTSYSTSPATASTSSASSSSTPRPENSTFRCPICRELIHVPRGGKNKIIWSMRRNGWSMHLLHLNFTIKLYFDKYLQALLLCLLRFL